ncbi:hypothetical protein [Armatimonas rosea]|uniref:Uncharacterized protein n=1 Tax=Armatimonas rosea TaxID=685828 RepID=A0A7W9SPF3_ARMRO|nr:hypothetical protein [Armatimonas rosea]MBB6049618.1 hypothetical protein [Armatimonas rosea]
MQLQQAERSLPETTLKRFFWLALFIFAQALLLASFFSPLQQSARILACDMVNIVVGILMYWLTPKWKLHYRIFAYVGVMTLLFLLMERFIAAGNFVPGMGRMSARFLLPLLMVIIIWPLASLRDKNSQRDKKCDKEIEWD